MGVAFRAQEVHVLQSQGPVGGVTPPQWQERSSGQKLFPRTGSPYESGQGSRQHRAPEFVRGHANQAKLLLRVPLPSQSMRREMYEEITMVVDSRASDHIVRRRDSLSNVCSISPRTVVLGDGSTIKATVKGTVVLSCYIRNAHTITERGRLSQGCPSGA